MLDARFVELPSSLKALPGVQHAPCRVTADGVKLDTGRGSSLQCVVASTWPTPPCCLATLLTRVVVTSLLLFHGFSVRRPTGVGGSSTPWQTLRMHLCCQPRLLMV